jgi:hypothetical protein
MRWHLIIEEFCPKLTYIKGVNNVVADALSRMKMTEKDFGPEVFAGGERVKQKFPLSYKLLAKTQAKNSQEVAKETAIQGSNDLRLQDVPTFRQGIPTCDSR